MGLPKGYKGKTPLWNERRKLSFMTTMLEKRKVRFDELLAADAQRVQEQAAKVAEMEAAEAGKSNDPEEAARAQGLVWL